MSVVFPPRRRQETAGDGGGSRKLKKKTEKASTCSLVTSIACDAFSSQRCQRDHSHLGLTARGSIGERGRWARCGREKRGRRCRRRSRLWKQKMNFALDYFVSTSSKNYYESRHSPKGRGRSAAPQNTFCSTQKDLLSSREFQTNCEASREHRRRRSGAAKEIDDGFFFGFLFSSTSTSSSTILSPCQSLRRHAP